MLISGPVPGRRGRNQRRTRQRRREETCVDCVRIRVVSCPQGRKKKTRQGSFGTEASAEKNKARCGRVDRTGPSSPLGNATASMCVTCRTDHQCRKVSAGTADRLWQTLPILPVGRPVRRKE